MIQEIQLVRIVDTFRPLFNTTYFVDVDGERFLPSPPLLLLVRCSDGLLGLSCLLNGFS